MRKGGWFVEIFYPEGVQRFDDEVAPDGYATAEIANQSRRNIEHFWEAGRRGIPVQVTWEGEV